MFALRIAVSLLSLFTPSWNILQSHQMMTPAMLLVAVPTDFPVTPSSYWKMLASGQPSFSLLLCLPTFLVSSPSTCVIHDSITIPLLPHPPYLDSRPQNSNFLTKPSYIFPANPTPANLNPTLPILGLDPRSFTQLEKQNKQRAKLPVSTLNIWFKKNQMGFPHDHSTILYFGH